MEPFEDRDRLGDGNLGDDAAILGVNVGNLAGRPIRCRHAHTPIKKHLKWPNPVFRGLVQLEVLVMVDSAATDVDEP